MIPAPTGKAWRDILGLPAGTVTADSVNAAYRRLAAERHPDTPGGSNALMAELSSARETGLKEIGP